MEHPTQNVKVYNDASKAKGTILSNKRKENDDCTENFKSHKTSAKFNDKNEPGYQGKLKYTEDL